MPNVSHSSFTNLNLHVDKAIKTAVRAASTTTLTLTGPGATIDGVTMASGDRFLAKDQTLPAANGIYVWNGAASTATRSSDAASAADFVYGFQVFAREGTVNSASLWMFTQSAALTIGTTALTFTKVNAGAGSVTSVAMTVPAEFTVAGSPITTSGTFAISKVAQAGNLAYASPNGSSGVPTMRALVEADITNLSADLSAKAPIASPTFTGSVGAPAVSLSGLTGSDTAAIRFVGATTTGAPAAGAHSVGDVAGDSTGKLWYCTVAGTPGTFVQVGAGGAATMTIQELDASPSVVASTLNFPNGTLTDNGGGSVTYNPGASAASVGAILFLARVAI